MSFDWNDKTVVGIIAGGGHLPLLIADEFKKKNISYHLFPIESQVDLSLLCSHPYTPIYWGQVAKTLQIFRDYHINTLVLAGGVKRPSFLNLKLDTMGIKWLGILGKNAFGDDGLLSGITKLLKQEGFNIIGSEAILPHAKTNIGVLGKCIPSATDLEDIKKGIQIAHTLGQLDVGQATIVENQVVLGMEGIEGTAALIARCASLKRESKAGVLVKVCKPQQSQQVDLPTIGPDTVDQIVAAGLNGIALESNKSLMLFPEQIIEKANMAGIFIYGF